MSCKRIQILSFVLVFTVVISFGCSKLKPRPEGEGTGITPGIAAYPHPEGWSNPHSHGIWVNQHTFEACLVCHEIESDQHEASPTCFSCHPLYPHSDGWNRSENHGAYVNQNGQGVCATQCHGTDLSGGLSNVSCSTCHDIYPHAADWGDSSKHGRYVNDNGIANCKTACHGIDLGGGTSGVSCTSCHSLYPHPNGWKEKAGHGAYVIANGYEGCKTPCHGTDLGGGTSGVSCASCHPDYPHTDPNWASGTGHGSYYSSKYNSTSTDDSCRTCHRAPAPFVDPATLTNMGCNCHQPHESSPFSAVQIEAAIAELNSHADCYRCHTAYPHMAYEIPGIGTQQWKDPSAPVDNMHSNYFMNASVGGKGHIWYLMRSPFFVDGSGERPWTAASFANPNLIPAVQNTCGGNTPNLCHNGGSRWSQPVIFQPENMAGDNLTSSLCAGYCHHP